MSLDGQADPNIEILDLHIEFGFGVIPTPKSVHILHQKSQTLWNQGKSIIWTCGSQYGRTFDSELFRTKRALCKPDNCTFCARLQSDQFIFRTIGSVIEAWLARHSNIYVYIYVYICIFTYVYTYIYMYVCMYVCMYVGMYVCLYVRTRKYVFMHVCMCLCTHTYTHTHTHTHKHTHTHTLMPYMCALYECLILYRCSAGPHELHQLTVSKRCHEHRARPSRRPNRLDVYDVWWCDICVMMWHHTESISMHTLPRTSRTFV